MRFLLLTTLLCTAVLSQQPQAKATQRPTEQEPTGTAKKREPSPAEKKAIARMKADLGLANNRLKAVPHAYTGNLSVASYGDISQMLPLERTFTGATDGTIAWFTMDGWNVAARGRKVAVQQGDAQWTEPQGDSPDVPISPQLFVPHLLTAKLSLPKPAEHRGRPALRVHAVWTGKPIKNLMFEMTVPSSQHEQVIEALARSAARGRKNMQLDATMLYDPASRDWLSATLRFAYMDGKPVPDDEQPPAAPEGLPVLPCQPMIEATWHMERRDYRQAERPDYDARARQLLVLDDRGLPLPLKKSSQKKLPPKKPAPKKKR